ncbi:MAG: hypothetical protein JXR85_01260 [Deltaproteobacteria bacterium]|nr:hypothetical protein [Deltaproteobacteria bacterium]
MLFLDPHKPIATCESDSCEDCAVNSDLRCHFTLKDWIYFLFISVPPFLLGGAGIYYMNGWLLIPWILFVVAYFGFIEIRVMCSHCPHYAESSTSLKCWANYGSAQIMEIQAGADDNYRKNDFPGRFCNCLGLSFAVSHPWETAFPVAHLRDDDHRLFSDHDEFPVFTVYKFCLSA